MKPLPDIRTDRVDWWKFEYLGTVTFSQLLAWMYCYGEMWPLLRQAHPFYSWGQKSHQAR